MQSRLNSLNRRSLERFNNESPAEALREVMHMPDHETLLLIFVALAGVAVLLQAFVLLGILLAMLKALKIAQEKTEELRATTLPMLNEAREFISRVGPEVDSIATDLAEVVHGLRAQSVELEASTAEVMERVRRQTSRIDAMLTSVLDTVDRAGGAVSHAVSVPLRQMSAFAAAAKAVFGALRNGSPTADRTHSAADKDMFV